MRLAPTEDSVNSYQHAKVAKALPPEIACASFDVKSIGKQISALLAARYKSELRFLPQPGLWVYRDPVLDRWREAKAEPLQRAREICEEAARSLGRGWLGNAEFHGEACAEACRAGAAVAPPGGV